MIDVIAVKAAALMAGILKRLGRKKARANNPMTNMVTRSCEIKIANLTKKGFGFADALMSPNNWKLSISSDIMTSEKALCFFI
ncbi:hypothetical protein [Acinetobacter sp. ANC 4633]